jgi:hypothetical protein
MTDTRSSLIDEIVVAARWKPLPIVERRESLYSDGKWYSAFGVPLGVKAMGETRSAGFVYLAENGTTVGTRQPTREAAEAQQQKYQDKQDADFRAVLLEMTPEELKRQERYWLKRVPTFQVTV